MVRYRMLTEKGLSFVDAVVAGVLGSVIAVMRFQNALQLIFGTRYS